MKNHTLQYKWMTITTLIMFTTIILFYLIIIFFLEDTLREGEAEEAEHSLSDIVSLIQTRPINNISILDLSVSLENYEGVIIYNHIGQKIMKSSDESTIQFIPNNNLQKADRIQVIQNNGKEYLVITEPLRSPNLKGYSVLIHSLEYYNNLVKSLYIIAVVFGLLATVITVCISYFVSKNTTKPLVTMSNKMNQIRRDGFQDKLELDTSYKEIDNSIETFNEMMYQTEASFNQQRQFVKDASHELRTPLQIVQGHLNLIKRRGKKDPDILEESLNISLEEMNRITKLVEELLLLTKDEVNMQSLEKEGVDINEEIQLQIKALQQLHPNYLFEIELEQKPLVLQVNRHQFEQLILIFIDNAMKYNKERKHICIKTQLCNRQISIEITDHGLGIPKKDQGFTFDRFYRVDKSRTRSQGGNGLGLPIAEKIVSQHGGYISVNSEFS